MLQFMPMLGPRQSSVDATITLTDSPVSTSDLTAYTFTAAAIGTAAVGRRVIVCVSGYSGSNPAVSSVTVGGNAATAVVSQISVGQRSAIYIIQVDTGTTADIVVTFSVGCSFCGAAVFAAYNLLSSTATDTGSSTANPATGTMNISAGGVGVAYAAAYAAASRTFTWAGLTERVDEDVEAALFDTHSAASAAFASAQTGLTVTATPSAAVSAISLVRASFR